MTKEARVPNFGVLSGVKVVHATLSTAGPFGNEMLAEMGADVIWIENSMAPDVNRINTGMGAQSERRNQRTISLNIPTPEGKEIFFRLIKEADIFMEASKGGQYERWGLTDEVLWEVNPKLVIVHMSGFGLTGDPDFIGRACYDPIAQAFSGLMQHQGNPGMPPVPAFMLPTDYLAGLTAALGAVSALHKVKETGKGESIDVAQYEVAFRCQAQKTGEFFNLDIALPREGGQNVRTVGWGVYECKDGNYVYLLILGVPILKKALEIFGLKQGSEEFPLGQSNVLRGTPGGNKLEEKIEEFCQKYTAEELENLLWPQGIPCCRVMDYEDIDRHPHYAARGSIAEWESHDGKMIRGSAPVPKFKNYPGKIWRGAPTIGMDNEIILGDLGFNQEEIEVFYEKEIIRKGGFHK